MIINIARAGAIGDVIATSTVIDGLKKKYPDCTIHYYTNIQKAAELIEGVSCIFPSSKWNNRIVGIDCLMEGYPRNEGYPNFPMKRHLTEYYADNAGVYVGDFSFKPFYQNLVTGQFITLHVKTGWSIYKEWFFDRWEQTIKEIKPLIKNIKIVQIGSSNDPKIEGVDIDLLGKTSLEQSCALIQDGILHCGVDSFSNHVAGGLKKKAVILFGSTNPVGFGYPSAINIWKQVPCSPCYKENPEISNETQGTCFHKNCMEQISVDDVKNVILSQLGDMI